MRSVSFLGLALALLVSGLSHAAQPSLGSIAPEGFQRGTELEVTVNGARLGDAEQLLFYTPGFTTKAITKVNDNSFKATLAIAPDCRLGLHAVRVRTASGLSNLKTVSVGNLPEVAEVEPNTEFATPQAIPFGAVVRGVVQAEDVDHYVIEAKQGERITAELEGLRLGNTLFDPYLAILNAARFELARSDDAPLLLQDCVCSVIAPADGKYIVQVRESAYGGNGACSYRLHVGKFPRPTAVIPAGGRPGETIEVRWLGDSKGDWTEKITLPSNLSLPEHGLYAANAEGVAPSPNVVRVVDLQNYLEAEPNDAREQASAGGAPGALNGIIEKPGDVDFFKFAAKAGQVFEIRVHARKPHRSPLDSVLTILRADGAALASNDDSGGPDSYLRFQAPADGDYFAVVSDHLKGGGPTHLYRVELSPVKAALTMSVPEKVQYVSTILEVPRGNRMALMMNANRANFGGDLALAIEGMPAGLTFQTLPITANMTSVPVLFTAAADAAPLATLADVVGRTTDPNQKIDGHLYQRTMLLRGQGNADVWGHDADRLATAITQEVPFKVDIVQPSVPIVRDGSMDLRVVATRAAGFTAPIAISLLYNPSGIGSSTSIQIPADKSEAAIPLTANGGAAIGAWPIIVLARATVGNGTIEIASQMAQLTIADRFFDMAFQKSAGEQGTETEVVVTVTKKSDFTGDGKVELLGLPANTTVIGDPLAINKDTAELVFKVNVAKEARPGVYKSLVARTTLPQGSEAITTTLGTGELRVDQPLPPTVAAPKPAATPMPAAPMPMPAAVAQQPAAPPRRLTRLEQLRLQREQTKDPNAGK